jgi:protein-tyrosine phosphatase
MTGRILVLCSGNICRSPLAGALLARDLSVKTIGSAGLAAPVGLRARRLAEEKYDVRKVNAVMLREMGIA